VEALQIGVYRTASFPVFGLLLFNRIDTH